ncbi:hypothetical protein LguiA_030695 [Lonicera macranthoides]
MSITKQFLVLLICVVLLTTPSLGDHHKPPQHGHKPPHHRHKPPTLDGRIPDDHRSLGVGRPRHGPHPPLGKVDQLRPPGRRPPRPRRPPGGRPPRPRPPPG